MSLKCWSATKQKIIKGEVLALSKDKQLPTSLSSVCFMKLQLLLDRMLMICFMNHVSLLTNSSNKINNLIVRSRETVL